MLGAPRLRVSRTADRIEREDKLFARLRLESDEVFRLMSRLNVLCQDGFADLFEYNFYGPS
jgi:hypothetical protein